ncbi:Kinesin-like protein [Leptomonas seymouri]|uniref:Kinesin-like protein n=1 Tax=Leptomonas seymouri TaxID=5684 RepID=A0A0N1I0B4_LEPSE|nr:Kinesin-like protein [Leptomonas seymouri]|eukprot:KPI88045.1 Kinesin-like protein [Leptomonas seymouri]
MSSSENKKILYVNRRRSSDAVRPSPRPALTLGKRCSRPPSPAFASPTSTSGKHSPLSGRNGLTFQRARNSGCSTPSPSSSQAHRGSSCVSGARAQISSLTTVSPQDGLAREPGEQLLPTSTSAAIVHRPPTIELPRSNIVGSTKSCYTHSNGGGKGSGAARKGSQPSRRTAPAAGAEKTNEGGPSHPFAVPAATTAGSNGTAEGSMERTCLVGETTANATSDGICKGNSALQTQPSVVTHRGSSQGLDSPQGAAFGRVCEGVNGERVGSNPCELLCPRNATLEPGTTRQSTTLNDEASLSVTKNIIASAHALLPNQEATAVPSLKQVESSCERDPISQAPSALCKVENPIDVHVAAEGVGSTVSSSIRRHAVLDATATPKETGADPENGGTHACHAAPVVTTKSERRESTEMQPPAASVSAVPREVNIFVAVRLRPCSEARTWKSASAAAAAAAAAAAGTSGEDAVGCVRADVQRGFVECSIVTPASALGTYGNGTPTSAFASAGGGTAAATSTATGFEKYDAATGKRIRTLRFFFDHILDEHVSQRGVMESIGQRAVEHVLAGYHGTVMCYGQSGSGKTHTIIGPHGGKLKKKALRWRGAAAAAAPQPLSESTSDQAASISSAPNLSLPTQSNDQVRIASDVGLLPRMLSALFSGLEARRLDSDEDCAGAHDKNGSLASWSVTFSALELYNEQLRDLLPQGMGAARRKKKPTAAKRRDDSQQEAVVDASKCRADVPSSGASTNRKGVAAKSSPASGPASLWGFPTSASARGTAKCRGGRGTSKKMVGSAPYWDAEDLDVLNAVSSSDDGSDEDDDENEEIEGGDTRSSSSSSGRRIGTPDTTEHLHELQLPQQQDENDDCEPDPSRPTTSVTIATAESARVRMTVGQLTSVSPSPPRHTQSVSGNGDGGAAAPTVVKKQVVVIDAKAGNSSNTTSTGLNSALPSRIACRPSNSAAPTSTSQPLKPPVKDGPGLSTGLAPLTQSVTSTPTAPRNVAASRSLGSGSHPLLIRHKQPPMSSIIHTSTAASATASFASATTNGSQSTSATSRSAARPRGRHANAARDADEAVCIEGLREHPIRNLREAMRAVQRALRHRQMASTELNSDSSRAHTFFIIHVKQRQWRRRRGDTSSGTSGGNGEAGPGKSENSRAGKLVLNVRCSTLTLVDLGGSERVSHTGAHGLRLKEAQKINRSLSALGNVMRILSSSAATSSATAVGSDTHVPYRDSKLTRILQSSLGGNAITFLLCNVSPDVRDASETMSTLRFAKLSKNVKNKAKLNERVAVVDESAAGSSSSASSVSLLEKYKRELQDALAAALASESKLKEVAGDASHAHDRMCQMATYVWWLEEQLSYFASLHGAIIGGTIGGEQGTGYPTVSASPASLTSRLGGLRSREEGSSSVRSLDDTECVVDSNAALRDWRSSEKLSDSSSRWHPSDAAPGAEEEMKHRASEATIGSTVSPLTPSHGAFQCWPSLPTRAPLSPSCSVMERRREMQRYLIAAAAAAGLAYSPWIRQHQQQPFGDTQADLTQGKSRASVLGLASAALTDGSSPAAALPFTRFLQPPVCSSIPMSGEQQQQQQQQSYDPSSDPKLGSTLNSSGVIVSASSMADVQSPHPSTSGDVQPGQTQCTSPSPLPLPHNLQTADVPSPLAVPHSAVQSAPSSSIHTPVQSQQQPIPNFAVALAEERRARVAAQARLAETESQNFFLRLRLSSLQQQQRWKDDLPAEGVHSPSTEESTADSSSATATTSDGAHAMRPSPSSAATSSFSSPFQWPRHHNRVSSEASLAAFLARCGFVHLDEATAVAGAAPTLPSTRASSPSPQRRYPLELFSAYPSDSQAQRGITVDPSSMQALRDGSVPRDGPLWSSKGRAGAADGDGADADDLMSDAFSTAATEVTSVSSVLAVVNAAAPVEHLRSETPVRPTTGRDNGRSSSHRRPHAMGLGSPDVSPRERSPGWGQQLLDSVRTTLETVRTMRSHETFYEPDDINSPRN